MATCISCGYAQNLGTSDQHINYTCPGCLRTDGYEIYQYNQCTEQDVNYKEEQHQLSLYKWVYGDFPQENYLQKGSCFANTLLWAQFKKKAGFSFGQKLEVFAKEYIGEKESRFYTAVVDLMRSDAGVVKALMSDFQYPHYQLLEGRDVHSMDVSGTRLKLGIQCNSCRIATETVQKPPANGGQCPKCHVPGRTMAFFDCSSCQKEIGCFKPGWIQCQCQMIYNMEPISQFTDIKGRSNNNLAHEKKRKLYGEKVKLYDLEMVDYKNGYNFNVSDITEISNVVTPHVNLGGCVVAMIGFSCEKGAHVTSLCSNNGAISFFDPNCGEYIFKNWSAFKRWFILLMKTKRYEAHNLSYADMNDEWFVVILK